MIFYIKKFFTHIVVWLGYIVLAVILLGMFIFLRRDITAGFRTK